MSTQAATQPAAAPVPVAGPVPPAVQPPTTTSPAPEIDHAAREALMWDIMNQTAEGDEPYSSKSADGGYVDIKDIPKSPTVINVDNWAKRRGEEIAKTNEKFKKASVDELESADFFSSLFEPEVEMAHNPADKLRKDYMTNLIETPDYQEIRQVTMLDDMASEIACTEFGMSWAKLRTDTAAAIKKNEERVANGKQPKPLPSPLGAAASGLQNAKKDVQSMQAAMDGFGVGDGMDGGMDANRIRSMLKRVQSSTNLRKILELAGRFKLVAQSCQKRKITVGNDEIHGVTLGSDISRVVQSEFGYYHHPKLRRLFLSRFIEQNLMCRDVRAHERIARGPIVVVIDESGSMSGERIETAKAMMLAMGWIARRQKRWFAVAAFSDSNRGRFAMFPTGQWSESVMMDWIEAFMNGGTNLQVPLVEVPKFLDVNKGKGCPTGKIDMILITDGIVPCPPEMCEHFIAWKKKNEARLITIIIQSEPGELEHVSDEVFKVNNIDLTGDAVSASFSI